MTKGFYALDESVVGPIVSRAVLRSTTGSCCGGLQLAALGSGPLGGAGRLDRLLRGHVLSQSSLRQPAPRRILSAQRYQTIQP